MKTKKSRLRLKSADSLKFTRGEIHEFAVQVRDRTQAFFIAGRQDNPLFVTPRITDAKTQARVERAISKALLSSKKFRRVSFANAPAADGVAVILSLRAIPGSCTHCGERFRRLLTDFRYVQRGDDVTQRVEPLLVKRGEITSQIFVCPSCKNTDQQEEKGPVQGPGSADLTRNSPENDADFAPLAENAVLRSLEEF